MQHHQNNFFSIKCLLVHKSMTKKKHYAFNCNTVRNNNERNDFCVECTKNLSAKTIYWVIVYNYTTSGRIVTCQTIKP